MVTQKPDKKKIESHYMKEAQRASFIFPYGELIQHEKPDFLLHTTDRGTIGIEVTELCREEQRKEGGRLAKVPNTAKERYNRLADAEPVDVSVAFSVQAENIRFNKLTKSLADFVYRNRNNKWSVFTRDLPEGYCHIGIHAPLEPTGFWMGVKAFDTVVASKELLESRIAEKNQRVPDYRVSASEVWLLIVNDQFLGAGEVYARPDHLAEWKFVFDFEKVLLFSREPGGGGEVIELQKV